MALSEAQLEQALVAGLSHDEIAARFKCSKRTVIRRVRAAKARHGAGWPAAAKPRLEPMTPEPIPESGLSGMEAMRLGRDVLVAAARGLAVTGTQINAARALATTPPIDAPTSAPQSHTVLADRLRRTAKALDPDDESVSEPEQPPVH